MNRSVVQRAVFVLAVVGLLACSFVAGRLVTGRETVKAQTEFSSALPASPEASHHCYVNNVAAFDNRIHLRCSTSPGGGLLYFAYPTGGSNGYTASRILAVGQTANREPTALQSLTPGQWAALQASNALLLEQGPVSVYLPVFSGPVGFRCGREDITHRTLAAQRS